MTTGTRKPLFWIGSARRDLKEFPDDVQDMMGHALDIAQQGKKHQDAKPLSGFGGAGVLEIVEDSAGDTYRAVYTVLLRVRSMLFMLSKRNQKRESKHPGRKSN